jgi:ParB/RepB/Spo0J family partition protein
MKLEVVKLDQLYEEDRIRKEFGNIQELVHSIKKEGLIQPIAVAAMGDGRYRLLAGGRRLRACREAGLELIPIRVYDEDLTELQIKSIELAENIYRKDLEYAEEVKLCKEINDLQTAIHGRKISTAENAPGWSQRDTADLLGRSPASVTLDIQLAEAIELFPELANLKNKNEARKALSIMYESTVKEDLAKRLAEERRSTPEDQTKQEMINAFIIKDFFEGIKEVPNEWIDIIEIDPPYAINLASAKKHQSLGELQMEGYNEVEIDQYLPFMDNVLSECQRVLKDTGWLILWFGPDPWFSPLASLLQRNKFLFNKLPGLWVKKTEDKAAQAQSMMPSLYLANAYEMFFYARKGGSTMYKPGKQNVFLYPQVPTQRKIHPTERPIEMIQELLSIFAAPGSRVLVPFLGSGNTLLAASNLNMKAFGYELNQPYKDAFTIRVFESKLGEYKSYGP